MNNGGCIYFCFVRVLDFVCVCFDEFDSWFCLFVFGLVLLVFRFIGMSEKSLVLFNILFIILYFLIIWICMFLEEVEGRCFERDVRLGFCVCFNEVVFVVLGEGFYISYVIGGFFSILLILVVIVVLMLYRYKKFKFIDFGMGNFIYSNFFY